MLEAGRPRRCAPQAGAGLHRPCGDRDLTDKIEPNTTPSHTPLHPNTRLNQELFGASLRLIEAGGCVGLGVVLGSVAKTSEA